MSFLFVPLSLVPCYLSPPCPLPFFRRRVRLPCCRSSPCGRLIPSLLRSAALCPGMYEGLEFTLMVPFCLRPLVSRPSETSDGCSDVPSLAESSPPTASLFFPFLQLLPVLCLFAFVSRAFCSRLRLLFAVSRLLPLLLLWATLLRLLACLSCLVSAL